MASKLEELLACQIRDAAVPVPKREHCCVSSRGFRWDFAWPELMLAVEVQGQIWSKGAHSSGVGILRDHEKHNLATVAGWRVLYASGNTIRTGEFFKYLLQIIEENQS